MMIVHKYDKFTDASLLYYYRWDTKVSVFKFFSKAIKDQAIDMVNLCYE